MICLFGITSDSIILDIVFFASWNYCVSLLPLVLNMHIASEKFTMFTGSCNVSNQVYHADAYHLPNPMHHQSDEKDDKEVMGEPEHLKIGPANDFHGGRNDEDESEGDCYT